MPCDNPKCSLILNCKNKSNIFDNEIIFCEFFKCKKKFCKFKCLQSHYKEEHRFNVNSKCVDYKDLKIPQKKLLRKTIEQHICGNFLQENLSECKIKIANELEELIQKKTLQIKYEQIENQFNSIEYFYYFHIKNFENPDSAFNLCSNFNKTADFPNADASNNFSQDNNENNINNDDPHELFNNDNLKNNIENLDGTKNAVFNNSDNFPNKKFTKIIGSGAFGDVYLVKNNLDGKLFAIKQLNKERIKENGIQNNIVYREINTHFRLIHKNICRLFDYYEDRNAFYLIIEYIDNGTLFNKIQKSNGLSEEKALKYFMQVSSAIFFLHENKLIHRDIKPENCLIDKNDSVKLCDFGWTVEMTKGERVTFCGTYEYMAPEIIKEVPYNQSIDVWSLGVLLYELIHSFSPFRARQSNIKSLKNDPNDQIINNILNNKFEFEKDLSSECRDLIEKILHPNSNSRLNLKDIFTHTYIINYFIRKLNLEIAKMMDLFEKSLNTKKFIFIKFLSCLNTKSKVRHMSFLDELDISLNKSLLKKRKNSLNDLNNYMIRSNNKGETNTLKMQDIKIQNLKKNNFFFNIKSDFIKKLKIYSKPLKSKEALLNNLSSIIKENNSLLIKNNSTIDENFDEIFEEKLSYQNSRYEYIYPNKPISSNKCNNENSNLNSILKNKNSDLFEKVLDKIQYKKRRMYKSLDMDNCECNFLNILKKKKSSKRNISNLQNEMIFLNSSMNMQTLNSSNDLLNDQNRSREIKIAKPIMASSNNQSLQDLNNFLSNNGSMRIISENGEDIFNSFNRYSSMKEFINLSNQEPSINRDIQDFHDNIEIKKKKLDSFIEKKTDMKNILEENLMKANNFNAFKNYQDNLNYRQITNKNYNTNNNSFNNNNEANYDKTIKYINNNCNKYDNHFNHNNMLNKYNSYDIINNTEFNEDYNRSFIIKNNLNSQDFNFNTSDFNPSKKSDMRICKNENISHIDHSNFSLNNKNSFDLTKNNISDKKLINNIKNQNNYNFKNNNFNEFVNINKNNNSNNNNNFGVNESINNSSIINNSLLKSSEKKKENQNFSFSINKSYEKIELENLQEKIHLNKNTKSYKEEELSVSSNKSKISIINNKSDNKYNFIKNYLLIEEKKSGNSNTRKNEEINYSKIYKNNNSLIISTANNKDNSTYLAAENVNDFSLVSSIHLENNNIKNKMNKTMFTSKVKFDNSLNNSKGLSKKIKNNHNNENIKNEVIMLDKFNTLLRKSHKKNDSKSSMFFTSNNEGEIIHKIKNNNSLRKKTRKSINNAIKNKNRLSQIKESQDFVADNITNSNNNNSFEENTENKPLWKRFLGIFNVFKCGGGNVN